MKVAYFIPHVNTIYAGRTIYHGYKHAFTGQGHHFRFITADDDQSTVFKEYRPDILFTGLNRYVLRYLNIQALKEMRNEGTKVFVSIPFWKSPLSKLRVNESPGLSQLPDYVKLIQSGDFGDVFYNVCEPEDMRMDGFEKATGYEHTTIPLAADKYLQFPEFSGRFRSDISFLGTNLPEKRVFFREVINPLKSSYTVNYYGQDWSVGDRLLGMFQKVGQYFNLPVVRSIQKPKLALEDERRIYNSSVISINVHEEYQKKFGGDCNERTFKIPACNGFEIVDDVSCIRKYFREGTEIVIARDRDDWWDKIRYYTKNPDKRQEIIKRGNKRVLEEHTYDNRIKKVIEIFESIN